VNPFFGITDAVRDGPFSLEAVYRHRRHELQARRDRKYPEAPSPSFPDDHLASRVHFASISVGSTCPLMARYGPRLRTRTPRITLGSNTFGRFRVPLWHVLSLCVLSCRSLARYGRRVLVRTRPTAEECRTASYRTTRRVIV
jgi:hypothetical protein